MKKYSENFERDYKFYFKNKNNFNFCGTLTPKFKAIYDVDGKSAKEVFYLIDSTGKNDFTSQPDLLNELLLCKASVNFNIKQWAEGRADGTLPLIDFSKDLIIKDKGSVDESHKILEWVNGKSVQYRDMVEQYGLPYWVIEAVENQKTKIHNEKPYRN